MGILENLVEIYNNSEMGIQYFSVRIIFAIFILIFGILLGKLVYFSLKKVSFRAQLEKKIKPSFIDLFCNAIKWCVYIVFIDIALIQIPSTIITRSLAKTLAVIPALATALIIIAVGYGIAIYLREVVEDSEILGWKFLSLYIYYFIIFITGIYSLKIALISLDPFVANFILISIIAIITIAVCFYIVKKELSKKID